MTKPVCRFLAVLIVLLVSAPLLKAQPLLHLADQTVTREEFLKAYQKNNTDKTVTEESLKEYLELYTRYRLKVKAAYEQRLDTLSSQQQEMQNFRNQVADGYLNDDESMRRLVNEAFTRSQKDIRLAHIFVAIPRNAGPADTLALQARINEAYAALRKGKPFGQVAARYSDDTTARTNQGELGYITAFTLPYELENLAYDTRPGQFSKPYRSRGGFHIFKNLGERKAIGRIRTAQILFAFPPNGGAQGVAAVKKLADSVYDLLMHGANFPELAKRYSADNLSYQSGGEMPEFGTGRYETGFESAAFGLARDGDFTQPVRTAFGYHIIKRLSRSQVPSEINKDVFDAYRLKVLSDPRNELAKRNLLQKIQRLEHFPAPSVADKQLWAYTDSFLQHKSLPGGLDNQTVLYRLPKKSYLIKEWLDYIKAMKENRKLSQGKSDHDLQELYEQSVAMEYYRNHLEDYNAEFAYQLNEFKEGNLLFEIMQRNIWEKAASDSAGLKNYFDSHRDKYIWQPSADALLMTCGNEKAATDMQKKLRDNGAGFWRKLVDSSQGAVQADSARFELSQLPVSENRAFTEGSFTSLVSNTNDNTVSFAYLLHLYQERSPRNFSEARGFVINDYQTFLEDQWIAALKKKYPVTVEPSVWSALVKQETRTPGH